MKKTTRILRLQAALLILLLSVTGCRESGVPHADTAARNKISGITETQETSPEPSAPAVSEEVPVLANLAAAEHITVHTNRGNVPVSIIGIPVSSENTRRYRIDLSERYILYTTWEDADASDQETAFGEKDVQIHIVDLEKQEIVFSTPLSLPSHPYACMKNGSGWIIFGSHNDSSSQKNEMFSAYQITLSEGSFTVSQTEYPGYPVVRFGYITSPDGRYSAYRVNDDAQWHGGIELCDHSAGTTVRLLEDIVPGDMLNEKPASAEDAASHLALCFLDNTHLLYRINSSDGITPKSYAVMDVSDGSVTACDFGRYHFTALENGMLYLSDHYSFNDASAFNTVWMTSADNLHDGITDDELDAAASVNAEENVYTINPGMILEFKDNYCWHRSGYDASSGHSIFTILSADCANILAEVSYRTQDTEMSIYSSTLIFTVFVPVSELPNDIEHTVMKNESADDNFDTLTGLLSMTAEQISDMYGAMTYEYLEDGGSPVYSITDLPGVFVRYSNGSMHAPPPNDVLPHDIIVTEEYEYPIFGLTCGSDISSTKKLSWIHVICSQITGNLQTSSLVGDFILTVVSSCSCDPDTENWKEEFLSSPSGTVYSIRITRAADSYIAKMFSP